MSSVGFACGVDHQMLNSPSGSDSAILDVRPQLPPRLPLHNKFHGYIRGALAVAALVVLIYIYHYVVMPMAFKFQHQSLWKILIASAEVLHKCEVVYALDQGTLLGLYRDRDLILGDTDIDLLLLGSEQRTKLVECPEADGIFQAHGLTFNRERNANGGLAVRDQYNFYADVDTTVLVQGDSGPLLRDKTLPHCQPGIIGQATHRVACERPVGMCLPAQVLDLGKHQFLVPRDSAAFLELKYPGWQVPKRYDKGTDTTWWDTFKSNNLWFTDFLFVVSMGVRVVICSAHLSSYPTLIGVLCLVLLLCLLVVKRIRVARKKAKKQEVVPDAEVLERTPKLNATGKLIKLRAVPRSGSRETPN